jgi:hypothetical protein
MSKIKKIIQTAIKIISFVLLIPSFVFALFLYLEDDIVHAWFWGAVVGIGTTMLLFSSPNLKITEGIKKLGLFNWITIFFFTAMPFFIFADNNVLIRIFMWLCTLMGFVGYILFAKRGRDLIFGGGPRRKEEEGGRC